MSAVARQPASILEQHRSSTGKVGHDNVGRVETMRRWFDIEPNHRSPSAKYDSVPLMRGEPSARSVASVLWTRVSK